MKVKITYYACGDSVASEVVDVDTEAQLNGEIERLKKDPQAPLSHVKQIELVQEDYHE